MTTLAIWMPGNMEMLIILVVGLILFGKRLPEVGRSIGKSIVEFKRGLKDVEESIDESVNQPKQMNASQTSPQLQPPTTGSVSTADPRVGQGDLPETASNQPSPGTSS